MLFWRVHVPVASRDTGLGALFVVGGWRFEVVPGHVLVKAKGFKKAWDLLC